MAGLLLCFASFVSLFFAGIRLRLTHTSALGVRYSKNLSDLAGHLGIRTRHRYIGNLDERRKGVINHLIVAWIDPTVLYATA